MADEKVYTIPLRKAWRTPRTRRGKKAITIIREFILRHMKGEVKIGKSINHSVWARGIQKPPRRVKIHTTKKDDIVYAEMVGTDIKTLTKEEVKKKEEKIKEKQEKIKKDRKERKNMTVQEEIKAETVQVPAPIDKDIGKEEKKEDKIAKKEKSAKKAQSGKDTGKD